MSYSNRYNNGGKTDAYRSAGGGDTSPNNVVVLVNDDRMAILSIYTTSRNQRVCTITLAFVKKAPSILDEIERDTLLFGQQEARETVSVNEGLSLAKAWLAGQSATGEIL